MKIVENIVTAANGKEGILKLQEINRHEQICPQLIFLDLNMPVMDGFDFVHAYNNLPFKYKNKIRIIILTTSENMEDINKLRSLGITEVVSKPLTEQILTEIVEKNV